MVTESENVTKVMPYGLDDVLSEKQIQHIMKQWATEHNIEAAEDWILEGSEIKPATEGIAGFLGDHIRVKLIVRRGADKAETIYLFVKMIPKCNQPKANFIDQNNFYRREMIMYKMFEELGGSNGPEAWHPKCYICNETVVVMPDLVIEGYTQCPPLMYLDYEHTFLTAASLARFHASVANYETKRSLLQNRPYSMIQDYADTMAEPSFKDTPWLRAAAKLTVNFLKVFSVKQNNIENLENQLVKLFLEACDSFKEYDNTLNVVAHKDLWTNNIMFYYKDGKPVKSLLLDFQCLRYGPPGFDVMTFIYLNTSAAFRHTFERSLLQHYYDVFDKTVNEDTKKRLQNLGYTFEEFCKWCEKGRMFGILEAVAIFPYTLMEPRAAQECFDNPKTYEYYCDVDRTAPVVGHAHESRIYKERILETCEEFVQRYVLDK
ncbi:hypothetical protein JYU34_008562 [Plutella xylostella]|uniref:CHK kinase-like domain-containing protein n=1 Tax=Plutella xylostella TaxID=51655 RepID=A0ABQ7QN12_PLUXY|nr:hypothetical protein JYU34_008562 [Plutella xylostella]